MLQDKADSGLDIRFLRSMPDGEVSFRAVYDDDF